MKNSATIIISLLFVLAIGTVSGRMVIQPAGQKSDCLSCHRSSFSSNYTHFVESSDDCLFCHDDRSSNGKHRVLTFSDNVTCIACHVEQDHHDEQAGHNEMTCVSCHEAHGSDNEMMLISSAVKTCTQECHTQGDIGLSHPVGENTIDITTGHEMTCTSSCHSLHQAIEAKYLTVASNDLCQKCHTEKY